VRGIPFLLAALTVAMLVSGCRALSPPNLVLQRALVLTQAIGHDFWDANKGAYVELPGPGNIQAVRIHPHADGEAALADATLVLLDAYRRPLRSGPPDFLAN
jgi:hypothetical protein